MKEKYAEKPTKRSYKIGLLEIRASTEKNFEICNEIQRWVLQVRPNAENRVP